MLNLAAVTPWLSRCAFFWGTMGVLWTLMHEKRASLQAAQQAFEQLRPPVPKAAFKAAVKLALSAEPGD